MGRRRKLSGEQLKAMLEEKSLPQVAQLIAHLTALFGGPEGLARTIWVEFDQAKPGSLQRQRLLDRVLTLMAQVNEDMGGSDRSNVEKEDLLREFEAVIGELPDGEEERQPGAAPA